MNSVLRQRWLALPSQPIGEYQKRLLFLVLLLGITLLAAVVRLYRLDTYPERFDNDESVLSYDAWSIWRTGADHHGAVLPNNFRAFNEYLPGLAQYIQAPFVGILGPDIAAARLPFALMGIATVFLTGWLGRRWFGELAGLLAALFLATDPWHVNFSRLALTNSIVPFFTVLALIIFTRVTDIIHGNKRGRAATIAWIAFSALCFALLTRTYQPLKIEAPLLFGCCLLSLLSSLRGRWRLLVVWVGLYLLFSSPEWIDQFTHWDLFQVQFNHNNIFTLANWPLVFLSHYSSQYNPSSLFVDGLGGGESIRPQGVGQLFWLEGFFWVAAAIGLAGRYRLQSTGFNLPFLLGAWFLIWPVAAALTVTGVPTETRTINFLPLPQLLAGYGAEVVLDRLFSQTGRLRRMGAYLIVGAVVVIYLAFAIYFLIGFFYSPVMVRAQSDPIPFTDVPYNVGLAPVLDAVTAQATECDPIWVEGGNTAYIYFLFFTRYPPEKFQKAPRFETSVPPDNFTYIPWFANMRFTDLDTLLHADTFKYPPPPLCSGPHKTFMVIRKAFDSPDWQEIALSKTKTGAILWDAYRRAS